MALIFGHFSTGNINKNSSIEEALQCFAMDGQRTFDQISLENSKIYYCPSIIPHHIEHSASTDQIDYYCGYTFRRSHLPIQQRTQEIAKELSDPSFERFAHNFYRVQLTKNSLHLEVDILGGMPLFYRKTEDGVFFSSEFDPLVKLNSDNSTFSEGALRNFLNFGFTLPGETLHQEIEMVEPGKIITFKDSTRTTLTPEYLRPQRNDLSLKAIAKDFTNELKSAINGIFSDLNLDRMSLSANSDSRILLGLLDKKIRDSIQFDVKTSDKPTKSQFANILVVKELAQSLNLQFEEVSQATIEFSFQNYFCRFKDPFIRRVFPKFGNEFLQGDCVYLLPYRKERTDFRKPISCFEYIDMPYESESIENYFSWVNNLPTLNKEFYASILMFRTSFLSTVNEADPFWASPYQHIPKQISPFNIGEILWELCHIPNDLITDGHLLIEILKGLDPELTKIPYADPVTNYFGFPFKNIYNDERFKDRKFPTSSYHIPIEHLFELVSFDYHWKRDLDEVKLSLSDIHKTDSDETTRKFLLLFLYRKYFFSKQGKEFLIDLNPKALGFCRNYRQWQQQNKQEPQ